MTDSVVVPPADRHRALATMLVAFVDDPVVRWAFADPHTYATLWPAYCEAYAGAAFDHGTATSLEGYAAVALWLPPGVSSDDATMERMLRETAREPVLGELDGFFEGVAAAHPVFEHWYLPLIGVDPIARSRGLGTTLIRDALGRCDRDGLPAYLEATSPRSRDLYLRFGFEVVATVQSGSSPPMWPMLRPPGPA